MKQYQELLKHILKNGSERPDRTGTGTISTFGYQSRYDLAEGFPLVTTKKVNYEKVLGELLWMLSGSTNSNVCADKYGFKIWHKWADENGELGPVYGAQFREWSGFLDETIDQIEGVISSLKKDPFGRRHIVSAWSVHELQEMALPPCHLLFQFYVTNDGRLSCQLYQRSADVFLGIPFNIAGYATLIHIIAHLTGYKPREFVHTLGDAHIYLNHVEQVRELLEREPRELPALTIDTSIKTLEGFYDDNWREHFTLSGYNPHPPIKGEVSV